MSFETDSEAVRRELAESREADRAELAHLQACLKEREATLLAEGIRAREDLASIRSAFEDACKTLEASQDKLEAERAHALRREDEIAATLTEIENLRSELEASETRTAALHIRMQQLENSLANVDAAHLNLTGRLIQAERVRQELERRLAS